MSTFPSLAPSPSISKGCCDQSAYYSSLPWFRRLLAMLNWRPVVDYELREIEYKQRMKKLRGESLQVRSETEQIEKDNARLDAQLQNRCNLVQLRHQLDPSALNVRQVRDVIALLEEYGGMA